jgi:hypothetical protein
LTVALVEGAVCLVLLAPCLVTGALFGLGKALLSLAPPPNGPAGGGAAPAPGPRAKLSKARATRAADGAVTISVDYDLQPGALDATLSYIWVVRAGERVVLEQPRRADELGTRGTLRGVVPPPADVELRACLESKRLVPGQSGWQRQRISNVVKVAP